MPGTRLLDRLHGNLGPGPESPSAPSFLSIAERLADGIRNARGCCILLLLAGLLPQTVAASTVYECGGYDASGNLMYDPTIAYATGDWKAACELSRKKTEEYEHYAYGPPASVYVEFVRWKTWNGNFKWAVYNLWIVQPGGHYKEGTTVVGYIYFTLGTCSTGVVDPDTGKCLAPALGADKDKGCTRDGVGNPCNAGTGNKYQAETDFRGPVFTFVRYYNSAETQDVGLGVGWTSRFRKRLEIDGSTLIVRRADGRGEPWTKSNGQWSGDPDSKLRLVEDAAGFTLTTPDGGTEHYAPTGHLLSETTPSGRSTTYRYDAKGRLDTVEDAFGHRLAFTCDSDDHVQTVTDPAGRVYTYGYDANENLASVTYPDGTQRTYQYGNPDFSHHLTGITDGNGNRFATFAYDTRGRVVSTEHATTDNGSPQEKFTLDYQD